MPSAFGYYGGKSGLSRTIADLFPPHRSYVEPFFGSGAVFFQKKPAIHEIINDLDDAVIAFWRCLRSRRAELEEVCALTPHSRVEFDLANFRGVDTLAMDELEVARRFWIRVNQSFGKNDGHQTGFSVTTGRTQAITGSIFGRLGRFERCATRLSNATIEHLDAIELIRKPYIGKDTVIYVDPPYDADTRRSRRQGTACNDYRFDMGDEPSHRALASALHDTEATVFLSGAHSPLYDELYGDWDRNEYAVRMHASHPVTSRGKGKDDRVEVVWSNRDLHRDLTLF